MRSLVLAGAALIVAAHDPAELPYVAVPGYLDCSQGDPSMPEFEGVKPCRGAPTAGAITIACVGDSITAGGWPQIMQTNLNTVRSTSRCWVSAWHSQICGTVGARLRPSRARHEHATRTMHGSCTAHRSEVAAHATPPPPCMCAADPLTAHRTTSARVFILRAQ